MFQCPWCNTKLDLVDFTTGESGQPIHNDEVFCDTCLGFSIVDENGLLQKNNEKTPNALLKQVIQNIKIDTANAQ